MCELVECDCVNPRVCNDCNGTGYVKKGRVLPSDLKIAGDKVEEALGIKE